MNSARGEPVARELLLGCLRHFLQQAFGKAAAAFATRASNLFEHGGTSDRLAAEGGVEARRALRKSAIPPGGRPPRQGEAMWRCLADFDLVLAMDCALACRDDAKKRSASKD